jgi:hypothetical protein
VKQWAFQFLEERDIRYVSPDAQEETEMMIAKKILPRAFKDKEGKIIVNSTTNVSHFLKHVNSSKLLLERPTRYANIKREAL